MDSSKVEIPINMTDISLILRRRLEDIDNDMIDFYKVIKDFSVACDAELQNFVKDMASLQKNLNRVQLNQIKQIVETNADQDGQKTEWNQKTTLSSKYYNRL